MWEICYKRHSRGSSRPCDSPLPGRNGGRDHTHERIAMCHRSARLSSRLSSHSMHFPLLQVPSCHSHISHGSPESAICACLEGGDRLSQMASAASTTWMFLTFFRSGDVPPEPALTARVRTGYVGRNSVTRVTSNTVVEVTVAEICRK